MRSVGWTPVAEADLAAIDDYLGAFNEDLAERAAAKVQAAASFLTNAPHAGAALQGGNARKWNVRQTPYLLVYRIGETRIEILRVHHNRENWQID